MSDAVRTALRLIARLVCWVIVGVAAFFGAIAVVMVIAPDRPGARGGGVVVLLLAVAVAAGAVWGLRHTPKLRKPLDDAPARELERVRSGDTIVLRPGRRRSVLLLIASVTFAGLSVWALTSRPSVIWVAGAVLFGAGTVVSALRLIPGRMYLRISPDGLLVHGPLRNRLWRWNDIAGFKAYEIYAYNNTQRMVGFTRRDVDRRRQGWWKSLNRGMSGVDVSLPDTYGLRNDDLCALLDEAHDRYATVHGPNPADVRIEAEAAHVRQDRLPLVTATLVLSCLAVFVVEVSSYGLFPDGQELYDAGAASRFALSEGRWWTLLAGNVLHAGPIHIVLNLLALAVIGWLLERELGWARMGLLCLAAGVAAMGAAVVLQPHTEVVGISGVIFALAGCAVVRDKLRTRALGAVGWSVLPSGLVYTFLAPHVSIGAHVGGLLAGLALGRAFAATGRRPHGRVVVA